MHPILRNIIAVIAGVAIGGFVNMSLIMVSGSVIPPPEGGRHDNNRRPTSGYALDGNETFHHAISCPRFGNLGWCAANRHYCREP